MKKLSVLALVLAMVMMMSVSSFAADPAFVAEDAVYTDGTAIAEGYLTVAAGANSIDATINDASAGNYYGIILVTGDALPTAENTILYINQATAPSVAEGEKSVVDFDVLPIIPTELKDAEGNATYTLGDPLTLYISSNVSGDKLIKVPLVYDEEKAAYALGDVNGDTVIDSSDSLAVLLYFANGTAFETAAGESVPVEIGNVNGDEAVDSSDSLAILLYFANGTEF